MNTGGRLRYASAMRLENRARLHVRTRETRRTFCGRWHVCMILTRPGVGVQGLCNCRPTE
jgi:hypothetical protein